MAGRSIRFPQMHVAQSTANRILNVAAGLPSLPPEPMVPPPVPDVAAAGQSLDAEIATPPVPAELPEGADGALVAAVLGGEDLALASLGPLLAS